MEAGLPNITGSLGLHRTYESFNTGCCEQTSEAQGDSGGAQINVAITKVNIKVSKSNPIYGNSSTVTPNSLITNFYISY